MLGATAIGLSEFIDGTAVECACFRQSPVNTSLALFTDADCAATCGDPASPMPCGRYMTPLRTVDHRHPTVVYDQSNLQFATTCESTCRSQYVMSGAGAGRGRGAVDGDWKRAGRRRGGCVGRSGSGIGGGGGGGRATALLATYR